MKDLTRRTFIGAMGVAGVSLAACGNSSESSDSSSASASASASGLTIAGTYARHIQGFEWGCGIDKVTLTLDAPLDSVDADTFAIAETKMSTDWTDDTFPIVEVTIPRTVTAAKILDGDGKSIEIELACAPDDGDSPLTFSMHTQYNTWSDPYYLVIGLAENTSVTSDGEAVAALDIDTKETETTTSVDDWKIDEYKTAEGTTINYAYFTPEEASKTLVVWLHGMGEGGTEATDPRVTLLANEAGTLADADFQEAVGGANVVAPQSPTYWMDNDGNSGNFNGGIEADGTSFYTKALEEFIDAYAQKVGAEKIVLAGCSNGGYMTMVLSISRPSAYACVVPICEALSDKFITDEQIASLKDLPMYFVYSKDDTTVVPAENEEPTIKRLQEAGKTDETLHVSTTEHVEDLSGNYKDADGNPYQYNGHWSWIYFFNNECECDVDGLKAWDFIVENVK